MTDEQIIHFIRHLIFEKHLKQTDIAERIGIDRRVIWSILSKKHSISNITREKIERYYKKTKT